MANHADTRLVRPRLSQHLLPRPELIQRLARGSRCRLTLISAPAGYGKSTLLGAWFEARGAPGAWLALTPGDSDPLVFLSHVVGAVRTVYPDACRSTANLLAALHTPPLDHLTSFFVGDLAELPEPCLLALDDYQAISGEAVHRLVTTLLQRGPKHLHLAIATRHDPPLGLARLRAAGDLAEVRTADLRFSEPETRQYLAQALGDRLTPAVAAILAERTEGWPAGLRLASLALESRADPAEFLAAAQQTGRYIMAYLAEEVLAGQPQPVQVFLQQTAILDRLCAPLCDAVLAAEPRAAELGAPPSARAGRGSSQAILEQLDRDNLFVIALDSENRWYRYHHLLQELLLRQLHARTSDEQRAALHTAASRWLEHQGEIEEALDHALVAHDLDQAAGIIARQRYRLLNETRWPLIDRCLRRLPPGELQRFPHMLMLAAWRLYQSGKWAMLPEALDRVEAGIVRAALGPEEARGLRGEIRTLASMLGYLSGDAQATIARGRQALEDTPRELWIVHVLGRLCLAAGLQMAGDLPGAYATMHAGLAEEVADTERARATLLHAACHIYWIAADLHGMRRSAELSLRLCEGQGSPSMLGFAHLHLGAVAYQQNDLGAAEEHFGAVVPQPYLHYGEVFTYCACGLALTYQAQGRPDEARAVAELAVRQLLEMGNATLLPVAQVFQVELALRQGFFADAQRWAAQLDPEMALTPMFRLYAPQLTPVKIWLAEATPASYRCAEQVLDRLHAFVEATHNVRYTIEVLALQALLHDAQGQAALALLRLEQALRLARPGDFVRLFVDLGPPMADLLQVLQIVDPELQQYVEQLIAAFDQAGDRRSDHSPLNGAAEPTLEALTSRERDVLACFVHRLTDKEIAERLGVSLNTVRTHTKNLFAKLGVHTRREAALRARELGMALA